MAGSQILNRMRRCVGLAVLLFLVVALAGMRAVTVAHSLRRGFGSMSGASETSTSPHTAGHMKLTALRTLQPGDQARAAVIVAQVKAAIAPYSDYHKALADGYEIFLPRVPQPQYHFTNRANALAARWRFDPLKPTSLLYTRAPHGGYKLLGAMYTDRFDASEDELNQRIPLSIARWHEHVNFCKAPPGQKRTYFGAGAKFGLLGSINTEEACTAAGGEFFPHVFGWMVHVYPYETDPKKVWSIEHDGNGHDNMDHSEMPGMKMD